MAVSIVPSDWLGAGYSASSGSHNITFQTSDAASNKTLPQLTDAKAHATTGDARDILFAIVHAFYEKWIALGAAGQTTNMRLSRSISGDSSGNITLGFGQQFTLSPGGIWTVVAEP